MHNTIDIPDTISGVIAPEQHPARAPLEADIQLLLGFETRMEVHGFLKAHGVYLHYGMADLEHDMRQADRIVAILNKVDAVGEPRPG